ncbi:transposase [Ktedonobacter sp. SOSP1-85]|uniref:RNA-guided endonuclease InsQ/TnpB family protein n=1 Tax=Ktedonobacter sp. SOSP1-85 TaxID=2778367 RepID=UPI001A1E616F|nr:transposase [Ktedonobacter sp. SOSP1-85]GHO79322.1 transposase [Ktedonobacter sp. SOSP1-85]GHO79352.1 transposase [Ktedonobacter sp. SOSP1-85]
MRKTYKYRLAPNKTVENKLHWVLARCRELYNAGLSERKDAYRMAGKSITYYDQQNVLPEIKAKIREEYQDIAAHVLQDVLKRLDKAFQRFFDRCAKGQKPGYPRFQGRNRYNSFTYPDGAGWKLDQQTRPPDKKGMVRVNLKLTKIGTVKLHLHRDMIGKVKTLTIKREGEHWYACFSCEVDKPEALPTSYEDVGIDLGVTHFAALSNGEFLENPRHYRRAENKLKKLQESLSRKKRGSHRRAKAVKRVAKAHRKVRNQRADFAHKASRKLVNRYQVIVLEDLTMANLVKQPKPKQDEETGQYLPNGAAAKAGLNKSIADAGWSQFVGMCTYKAAWAGRTLVQVDPKYTSQICPNCGNVRKKTLEERWHSCTCGCELDRDTASAKVILDIGRKQLSVGTRPTRATA